MQIPITRAVFDEAEKQAIIKPLESGWVVQGPYVSEFQKLFAEHAKISYAIAVSNCTTALHLGLESLGIGTGDSVVVPSFTYIASANAVEYTGATPLFCDIDLHTFNIDVAALEKLLKTYKNIRAIMPVHLFGLCANMPEIMRLAKLYSVKIIEDAACAFDSWIGDKHAGTFGDVGCFSFHPRKAITTGEGGMFVSNDEKLAQMVSQLRDHGASKSDLERHKNKGGSLLPDFNMRGYNYRMTDIQGALGVCQMQKSAKIMEGRRAIAARYDKALSKISALRIPTVSQNYIHGYQSYVCLYINGVDLTTLTLEKIDILNQRRNQIMAVLAEKGIATRQGTHAVHTLTYYKNKYNLKDEDFIQSYAADRLSITLPLYAGMTDEEFNYVVNELTEIMQPCVV